FLPWRGLGLCETFGLTARPSDANLSLNSVSCYIFKDKSLMEALNRLPWTAKDPIFERLAQISEISALTRDERIKYDAAIRYYRDNAHALEDAEEVGERKGWKRGHAAGVQQGMQQGMQQGFIETAKKLKAMGMSTSDIHIVTGLLPEDIDKL
ncbi:MAG: Rpn family recombination-promoting nuclease/putative transposase, partial [Bacteroidales bacterium]